MKHPILLLLAFYWTNYLAAQDCLPGMTVFSNQAQIDSFPILHPTCKRLQGNIVIMEGKGDTISDLSPFLQVTSIGERLEIIMNAQLASLKGFENLDSIDNNLFIAFNPKLTNLFGLDSLRKVGGNVGISYNKTLTNLEGINKLETIGKSLSLFSNDNLKSVNALQALHTIGGELSIKRCNSLMDFTGLESLNFIGSGLTASNNDQLKNLAGLSAVKYIPGLVYIFENHSLTSLEGLDQLDSIGAELRLTRNVNLQDFHGLNNLKKIGTNLIIQYDSTLTSLDGLEQLASVGGNVLIDFNPLLSDLTGLSALNSINGSILDITENISLTTLWGLENIDPTTIAKLNIRSCPDLSYCELPNICTYLDDPANEAEIYVNAPNCKNRKAIEEACELVSLEQPAPKGVISAYPNPVQDILTIETDQRLSVRISNTLGQPIDQFQIEPGTHQLDWSRWPSGIYFLQTNDVVRPMILRHE